VKGKDVNLPPYVDRDANKKDAVAQPYKERSVTEKKVTTQFYKKRKKILISAITLPPASASKPSDSACHGFFFVPTSIMFKSDAFYN
jgi:hypothetical protein